MNIYQFISTQNYLNSLRFTKPQIRSYLHFLLATKPPPEIIHAHLPSVSFKPKLFMLAGFHNCSIRNYLCSKELRKVQNGLISAFRSSVLFGLKKIML